MIVVNITITTAAAVKSITKTYWLILCSKFSQPSQFYNHYCKERKQIYLPNPTGVGEAQRRKSVCIIFKYMKPSNDKHCIITVILRRTLKDRTEELRRKKLQIWDHEKFNIDSNTKNFYHLNTICTYYWTL